jgi:hypothetical protein
MQLVSDISNEELAPLSNRARIDLHIEALEAEVERLRARTVIVKEVVPADMVTREAYDQLQKLYNDLWNETQAW